MKLPEIKLGAFTVHSDCEEDHFGTIRYLLGHLFHAQQQGLCEVRLHGIPVEPLNFEDCNGEPFPEDGQLKFNFMEVPI